MTVKDSTVKPATIAVTVAMKPAIIAPARDKAIEDHDRDDDNLESDETREHRCRDYDNHARHRRRPRPVGP